MLRTGPLTLTILLATALSAFAQNPRDFIRQAVQTELVADRNDHSHWLYFEVDRQPPKTVTQWVAEAGPADLKRVVERNGQHLSESQQRQEMSTFITNPAAQTKQKKNAQHDDQQATELLQMLPDAFIWNAVGERGDNLVFHFRPNPQFHPPDMEARVFAAMEGDMAIDRRQHRIASLKGRLIHDIKIGWGLLGQLDAGGTFDVERRELRPGVWEITETHVHIQGHALIFKTISENEDDVKSHFEEIGKWTTLPQAEAQLLQQSPDSNKTQISQRR